MTRRLALAVLLVGTLLAAPASAGVRTKTLRFAPGASSGTASDAVLRGDRDHYNVGARKGQRMTVGITSVERNAVFQIYRPGWKLDGDGFPAGTCLKGAGEGEDATSWSGTLPASGSYLVVVGGTRGNAAYKLTVGIK
jgi:hypothetical protein